MTSTRDFEHLFEDLMPATISPAEMIDTQIFTSDISPAQARTFMRLYITPWTQALREIIDHDPDANT